MDIMGIILGAVPYILGIGVVGAVVLKVMNFVKEVAQVLLAVADALEDNTVTKEEIAKIVAESKEVVAAAKAIFKK